MLDTRMETLLMVCEKNSFTRAAEALAMTQPAVSHHIRTLESELGIKLFYRGKNALKLTPEGEIVVQYARRIKALHEKMLRALAGAEKQMSNIRVGITHTAESSLIAEVLAKYSTSAPGLRLTVITDIIKNLYDMIDNYEIDLAIVEGRAPEGDINALLLDTDYLCLIVSVDHPFAHQQSVPLEDLKKEKLILRSKDAGTRMFFENFLWNQRESIQNFNIIMELDNIAMTKELVANNLGVSIIAKSACREEIRAGKLAAIPIENGSMVREIHLVFHPDFTQTKLLGDFCQIYNALC